jgi:hypothetical protein
VCPVSAGAEISAACGLPLRFCCINFPVIRYQLLIVNRSDEVLLHAICRKGFRVRPSVHMKDDFLVRDQYHM